MEVEKGSAVGLAEGVGALVAVAKAVALAVADGEAVTVALGSERMELLACVGREYQPAVSCRMG
jgi:hypothetical protein